MPASPAARIALFRACHYPPARHMLARIEQDHPMLTASLAPLTRPSRSRSHPRPLSDLQAPQTRSARNTVKSVGRTFLTKAADTKYVKDNAALLSSDDPNTPMKRAFLAHTLMRKDVCTENLSELMT